MKLYYQLSGFSGHYTLQQISLYLTSSQSAWGSGRNLWWGWGPLGGSHTMECHWYSPAHHQSSSSGTRLPCPHLQSVAEKKRNQVMRQLLTQNSTPWLLRTSEPEVGEGVDGSRKLQYGFQAAAKKLITGHYLLKQKLGQALEKGSNTVIIQSLPWKNPLFT